jgi:gas vesicle protein
VPATLGLEILPSIQALIEQLQASRDAQAQGTVLWNTYNDRLKKAGELSAKVAKNIGNAGQGQQDLNADLDKTLDKLELQASRIQSAVRGAIQLGEAFGLLDDRSSAMLQNITQIATEIPKVAAVLKAGGGLEKALPGLLGIAGGIAGLLGGLFGRTDPEEERRKEILRENTEAIEKLSDRIGEFFLDIKGADFAGASEAAERALQNRQVRNILEGNESSISGRRRRERQRAASAIQREFAAAGISMAELRDIAEELGLAFAGAIPTAQELKQLAEALANTELTRFTRTFTGQIELLSREFDLFDVSDPIEQLQRLRDIALGFGDSSLVEALFGGLDLSTAEGRAALEERIRALYQQFTDGTLTAQQFGGLTPQQLLDLLTQLESTMDQVGAAAEQGQTAQFQVSREVTEVTAGRLVSLLTTSEIWQQETAENTRAIAEILAGFRTGGGLTAPTAAEMAAYAGAGGITLNGDINVTVTAAPGMSQGDADQLGRAVGKGIVEELDRQMGARQRQRALLQGSVTRN